MQIFGYRIIFPLLKFVQTNGIQCAVSLKGTCLLTIKLIISYFQIKTPKTTIEAQCVICLFDI